MARESNDTNETYAGKGKVQYVQLPPVVPSSSSLIHSYACGYTDADSIAIIKICVDVASVCVIRDRRTHSTAVSYAPRFVHNCAISVEKKKEKKSNNNNKKSLSSLL